MPRTILPSACPLDCPDACSLDVEVEDGRVRVLDGNTANPATGGFICSKVRRFPEAMYGPHRILQPAVRDGRKGSGSLRDVSWDEALGLIAEKLARVRGDHGGEAILPLSYGGSNGLLSQDTTDARLFRRLGSSLLARTVCAAATGRAAEGLYGKMPGTAYADFAEARLIVVWGANPDASGIHLLPYIRQSRKNGARLVVVDPRRTRLARNADLHLAPRPGTDLPLALAVINWLFENGAADQEFLAAHTTGHQALREKAAIWNVPRAAQTCGISREEIVSFARLYAGSNPAVLRCGWGLERNRNGGSAVAAVIALPAVAGKFGVQGGGYTLSNSAAWRFSGTDPANQAPPPTRTVNMNRVGEVLTGDADPSVRFLFVYNCNPLATLPAQEKVKRGLGREDLFTVVFDSFLTDTARYADVVLPATTFLERWEIGQGYGAYALQSAAPVADRVGASRTNHEVFLELVRRLELTREGDPETETQVARAIFGENGALPGSGEIRRPDFGDRPVQFRDVFPRTKEEKVNLFPPDLEAEAAEGLYTYRPDPATDGFPLALISPATARTISSTLGQLHPGQVPILLNPTDARERGIGDGDRVKVWNDLGEVRCLARVSGEMRMGVVSLPKGIWSHNTLNGATSNALCPDTLTDLGAGACFNDARVQVSRMGPAGEGDLVREDKGLEEEA